MTVRRTQARGVEWSDLDDMEVVNPFLACLLETAEQFWPGLDRTEMEAAIAAFSTNLALDMAATAVGSEAFN